MKTLKFAFKINWPLIVPSDFQTFLQSWLRGNSAKQQQCFCIFWLAFRTLFPKVQWERPIKSKWVEPWTFGSIDLKYCIWWFWIRTFDLEGINLSCTYSRVPNTAVGNPYSFFGAWPSYMALFGTSRLLNFKKSSFLHFYSELLAYWFFPCTTLQLKVFVSNHW